MTQEELKQAEVDLEAAKKCFKEYQIHKKMLIHGIVGCLEEELTQNNFLEVLKVVQDIYLHICNMTKFWGEQVKIIEEKINTKNSTQGEQQNA